VVEKVIALIGAGGLAYTTVSANLIQNDLTTQRGQIEQVAKEQERQIQVRKDEREASKQQNELTQQIFQEFVKAITDKDTEAGRQLDRLEGVLVLTYAIPEPRQQEGMGRAVQKAMERIKAPEVATRVKAATFDAEELVARAAAEQRIPEVTNTPPADSGAVRWSNYDFDVFWCEGVPASAELQKRAADILALKSLDPTATGRWRPRPLPESVNDRPGYGISGNQIRYSSADEKRLAELLKAKIEAKFPPMTVDLVATSQNTPWYLSVFVCS
jgi:hypothetical protein